MKHLLNADYEKKTINFKIVTNEGATRQLDIILTLIRLPNWKLLRFNIIVLNISQKLTPLLSVLYYFSYLFINMRYKKSVANFVRYVAVFGSYE